MADTLTRLREVNDVPVYDVNGPELRSFGRVVTGVDVSEMTRVLLTQTLIPDKGNVYVPSLPALESAPEFDILRGGVFGGMPVQAGYCNGMNTTVGGFEYHKGSEINIAVTDFMLFLGHSYDIHENSYSASQALVFYVPRGTVLEMYAGTLHLSPCRVSGGGFRDGVILPLGTNTPLDGAPCDREGENRLLLAKNKWVIAHPEREPLIRQGAWPGLTGENKELHY